MESLGRNSDGGGPPLVDGAKDMVGRGNVRRSSVDGLAVTLPRHPYPCLRSDDGSRQNGDLTKRRLRSRSPSSITISPCMGRRISVESDISMDSLLFETPSSQASRLAVERRISVESDISLESLLIETPSRQASRLTVEKDGLSLESCSALLEVMAMPFTHDPHDAHNAVIAKRRLAEDDLLSSAASCPNLYSGSSQNSSKSCSVLSVKLQTDSKFKLRKKHQPQHRCPSVNGSVTSIVKAPRYSGSATLSSLATDRRNSLQHALRRKSFSQMMPSAIHEKTLKRLEDLLNTSIHMSGSASVSSASMSNMTDTKRWIPSGVIFNTSVEVYMFEK